GWPVLPIGFIVTILIPLNVYEDAQKEDRPRFEAETHQALKRIQYRMERYESALVQTRAFFLAADDVSRSEFRTYYEKTRIMERYPGIQGIGFALRVRARDLEDHVKNTRTEIPDYTIWPDYDRDEYYAIHYLEPEDERNNTALGFDMFTEP